MIDRAALSSFLNWRSLRSSHSSSQEISKRRRNASASRLLLAGEFMPPYVIAYSELVAQCELHHARIG